MQREQVIAADEEALIPATVNLFQQPIDRSACVRQGNKMSRGICRRRAGGALTDSDIG